MFLVQNMLFRCFWVPLLRQT